MRLIHRCVSIALAIIVILSVCISIVVFLPDTIRAEQDGDYTYSLFDGHATITGYTGDGVAITIPSSLGGYPVVTIGSKTFDRNSALTSVTIPDSVTSISDEAFRFCTVLNAVTFMGNAPTVGAHWSYQCGNIVVYYHDGATGFTTPTWEGDPCYPAVAPTASFSTDVISGSPPLTVGFTYTGVGANVLVWDFNNDGTVDGASQNPSYTYTAAGKYTVKLMVSGPYGPNAEVTKVDYITVTEGPIADFTYTSDGTSVTIVSYVGSGGNVVIPGEINGLPVGAIGEFAFIGRDSLTSVTIPNSVTTIETEAFSFCYSLTSVTIPGSVTSIRLGAFKECKSLTSVILSEGVSHISDQVFYGCSALTSVTLPSTITIIGEYAFSGCKSLTAITLPENIIHFDNFVFSGAGITSLTVPGNFENIAGYFLSGCDALTSVTLSEGVKSIGWNTFVGLPALTTVNIPSSLTSIFVYAFEDCPSLTSINVDEDNPIYASVDGILYNKTMTQLILYPAGKIGSFAAPISITNIGEYAFGGSRNLISVTLPGSVTTIGPDAFYGCTALTSITFQGLVAPTDVPQGWIGSAPAEIRGHAYAASNFPPPGGVWNGLTMGDVISTTPGAPTGLVVNPGNNQVTLRWDAPMNNGGEEIDHYIVYMNGTDVANVEGTTKTITGLTNGVSYDFAVAAHTSAGIGAISESVSATPRSPLTLVLPPNAPTDLTAVPGNSRVQLSWAAPNYDGGSPITGYNLSWSLTVDGPSTSTIVDGTSYLHEGLDNERTYYYKVAAINAMGESDKTEVVLATPMATIHLPLAPTNLIASVNNGNVSLTWAAPTNSGQISSYKIYRGTSPATIGLLTTISGTSFLDTNVMSNQTYYYQVSAVNAAGEGERSVDVNVTVSANNVPAPDPSPPFYDTLGGQVAIVGLIAVAGVGAVTYALWRPRRP